MRPQHWATPVEIAGVANLYRVSDGLYRSAQPTEEGMENLERFGIKTVINLRLFHSDVDEMSDTNMMYDENHMTTWCINDDDSLWFLNTVNTLEGAPFLVHCQHGADRTGCMVAMYRMVIQGWPKEEAIKELVLGGFGFHGVWMNIPHYLGDVDIPRIKELLEIWEKPLHNNTPDLPEPTGN